MYVADQCIHKRLRTVGKRLCVVTRMSGLRVKHLSNGQKRTVCTEIKFNLALVEQSADVWYKTELICVLSKSVTME